MIRFAARATQIALDIAILAAAFALAFLVRFDWAPPAQMVKRLAFTLPYVVLFQYLVLVSFGVHRAAWRYVGIPDAKRIFLASGATASALFVARAVAAQVVDGYAQAQYALVPGGVIAIDFALMFLGLAGARVLRRTLAERRESARHRDGNGHDRAVPTLLLGAGQAGVLVAREIAARPDLGIRAVGFLDDDPMKRGVDIHGIRVHGTTADVPQVAARLGAMQALITMASVPGTEIRRVTQLCKEAGLPVKIIPGVYEIVGGKIGLSRIRDVAIEDLLRREPVKLDLDAVGEFLAGKVVLVTGAGGSIGSELCRQVLRFEPKRLVLLDLSENNLFHIDRELVAVAGDRVASYLADIRDEARMRAVMAAEAPDVVFHAAAHKHVPIAEQNPGEAVKTNVLGTRVVADLSDELGVAAFVMISTDKAVNPTSVMGATKRVAEMYVQALGQRSRTRFVAVRFGNVLGSAGSVVPIFKEQIARGGPVTVTHPDMTRYFMTIPEACQLVLQAGSMGEGGEIFILDMGEPVRILDLAYDLIRLSGLRPREDVPVEFTGIRPGEKLFEELSVVEERADRTRHPKIYVGRIRMTPQHAIEHWLSQFSNSDANAPDAIRGMLGALVPEYTCSGSTAAHERHEPRGLRAQAPTHLPS